MTKIPKIDFSAVEDLVAIDENDYEATLTSFEYFPTSKSSGEPYYQLEFTVSEPPYAGRKLWRNFSCQKQALWAFKQAAVRLGADPDDLIGSVDMDEILEGIVGRDCVLRVGQREYEGEIRNEVKRVMAARTASAFG